MALPQRRPGPTIELIPLSSQVPLRLGSAQRPLRVALVGNPNCGKTTLFNRLTGLRARTSNFPGTTLESRSARFELAGRTVELFDLPGLYSTEHGHSEERLASEALRGGLPGMAPPDAVLVVLDATCLARHLYLASEVRELGRPMLVALNMMDEARQQGLTLCLDTLAAELDAPVIPVSGRTGEGVEDLRQALAGDLILDPLAERGRAQSMADRVICSSCAACPHARRHDWACAVGLATGIPDEATAHPRGDAVDRLVTHPIGGPICFATIMALLFVGIFKLASYPMDLIDAGFGRLGQALAAALPPGLLASFLVDGLLAGVGGVLLFLPQICILFFALTLLEDTGYLARAAFVADRFMQRVGLPGKAFIPMLSAHACAVPAIMSTKAIESRRDRLITILVIPLLTCSARLPVYAMVAALLFAGRPLLGGLLFFGAYGLGIVSAMGASLVLGKTILRGQPQELLIELPPYRRPSLRVALFVVWDRARVFLGQAGTVILALSMLIWAGSTFPRLNDADLVRLAEPEVASRYLALGEALDRQAPAATAQADPAAATDPGLASAAEPAELQAELAGIRAQQALRYSLIGRLGRGIEPLFAPLGFDWRISIGVLSSFAAREVLVSTLSIVAGLGDAGAAETPRLTQALSAMRRPDGAALFDLPTAMSLLVFFVLAMQCLPTQAVTRRETGSWRWPALQIGYMSVLAYAAAFVTYQLVSLLV
ncbi:MAG: ferrous iron transporter B [Caldilineae bacterium]|nr:ferrous iron transporter B [Chloroflexota bacterium]MCB9177532.1 ferrous iron transporter B [Caldilineae bacterium]